MHVPTIMLISRGTWPQLFWICRSMYYTSTQEMGYVLTDKHHQIALWLPYLFLVLLPSVVPGSPSAALQVGLLEGEHCNSKHRRTLTRKFDDLPSELSTCQCLYMVSIPTLLICTMYKIVRVYTTQVGFHCKT